MAKYKSKGYSVDSEVSVPYSDSFVIVDVVVKKDGKTIAIEIGNCLDTKLNYLKTKFDEVIHLPYLLESKDGYLKHYCGYTWKPRIKSPKECPRCKTRLDVKKDEQRRENTI